jgi:hypothetical protein
MNPIHPRSVGFAFGAFLGVWHALWAFLVWVGGAQWLLDFVFRLHMIAPPYHVTAFSPVSAATLVLFTAAVGYISGWFLGFLWNHCVVGRSSVWKVERQEPSHAR